jgi:hypothetical protein
VITLSNGNGSCTINFNTLGTKTITADYLGDSTHLASSDTATHEVLAGTPTITPTPTITLTPMPTLSPTITVTPAFTLTPVPSCVGITHGPITKTGNTMRMTITNPWNFPLITGVGSVTWNGDKGHQTGSDKTLNLQSITIAGTNVWTGNSINVSTMPWYIPAIIPANSTVTIVFTFHQSYDNFDKTESIYINLATPGCENYPIQS